MKRGQVWIARRLGHDHLVVLVGHDQVTAARDYVLSVPLSDARPASLTEPTVTTHDGAALGTAVTPRVGEIAKTYLVDQHATLAPASVDALDVALRAVLDL